MVNACWRTATNAKKKRKKWGNLGALNFRGAMEHLARGFRSVVELSTADQMVSGTYPDLPYLLEIGVP